MMAIPVGSDTGVSEPLVTTIEGDVVIHLAFVFFRILFRAGHARFFVGREKKDEVALGLDLRSVECTNGCEQGFDVAGIVADAGCIDAPVTYSGFDLESR